MQPPRGSCRQAALSKSGGADRLITTPAPAIDPARGALPDRQLGAWPLLDVGGEQLEAVAGEQQAFDLLAVGELDKGQ